ncbi:MAG: NUDIX domain-containing protein [Parachlamydia sp.]|nr:NUDIX domain-containing protein [Parachlamydia sp.]
MQPKRETCYGVIPLRSHEGQWQVLLIQHRKGNYWAFPKGHAEADETSQRAAERELHEETGLRVKRWMISETLREAYSFMRGNQPVDKEVHYFIAEVEGEVSLQSSEIVSSRWAALSEAPEIITYQDSRVVCRKAIELISNVDL